METISSRGVPRISDRRDDQTDHRGDDHQEPADHLGNHRFDVEFWPRRLHEFRGSAKKGLCSCEHHHTVTFSPADDGTGGKDVANSLVGIFGFASERRLIDTQACAAEELDIRWNDMPMRTRMISPGTSSRAGMACHSASRRTRAVTWMRFLGPRPHRPPVFLGEAQNCVDDQQRTHHHQVREFTKEGRQDHDQLKHPRRQARKFPDRI